VILSSATLASGKKRPRQIWMSLKDCNFQINQVFLQKQQCLLILKVTNFQKSIGSRKISEFATLFQCFPCTSGITTSKQRRVELEKNPRFPTAVDAMEVEHALHVCEKLKSFQETGKKAWKKDEKSHGCLRRKGWKKRYEEIFHPKRDKGSKHPKKRSDSSHQPSFFIPKFYHVQSNDSCFCQT